MKMISKIICALPFCFAAVLSLAVIDTREASAGELIRQARRVSLNNGGGRTRTIKKSTSADRSVSRARSNSRPMSFDESSPYEARIRNNHLAERNYQLAMAKYENKINVQASRLNERNIKRAKQESEKKIRLQKREADKLARQAEKIKRNKEREEKKKTRPAPLNLFGLGANQQQPAQPTSEQAKINALSTGDSGAGSYVAPTAVQPAPRMTLWQKIKMKIFGS
jgi:hypothetical protein